MDIKEAKELLKEQQQNNAQAFLDGYQKLTEETGFECFVIPNVVEIQSGVYAFKPTLGIRPTNGRDT